jgi:hypothetical protein
VFIIHGFQVLAEGHFVVQLQEVDLAWVQKELVDKKIKPVWEKYLRGVSPVRMPYSS